ncbi:HAD hydrolase family protein [Aliamphritea spongicola]|nr:HAD hydrolase family protein [Aliamphritea spongicola]
MVYTGCSNKIEALKLISKKYSLTYEEIAFVGDDIIDMLVLRSVGFSFSPSDAHPSIKNCVDHLMNLPGGRGVAREIADYILLNRGLNLEQAYKPLLDQWNNLDVVQ